MNTEIIGEKQFISKKIREARKKRGLTQHEVARLAGCKPPNIANIENGFGMPSAPLLVRLIKILDIKI